MNSDKRTYIVALCFALPLLFGFGWQSRHSLAQSSFLKKECLETLYLLSNSLIDLQIKEEAVPHYGAIRCPGCVVLHTRAAEAVFPFAVAYKHNGDSKYLQSAIKVGNWLISQQNQDGSWNETPEAWTGTTTDQLLMMACAFPIIREHLSDTEKQVWKTSIKKAADYIEEVMGPEFAGSNYCATSAASLAMVNLVVPDQRYSKKAKKLAVHVISKMDEDGFITGEGTRVRGEKYGVDLGYNIDMSLWGLGLYAKVTGDSLVDKHVQRALKTHLYFVYPDGSIDGSWGSRSNKWTTYGSKTADGCQILFSLYAPLDARYRTAAIRNLEYLRGMVKEGLIGYGPHFWNLFDTPPCIYPTFARAKNLALAVEFGEQQEGETPPLPSNQIGWVKFFPTVDVVLARSKDLMATITAYRYKDVKKREKSKYMHRPSGGSISNLWVEGHGFLQTSSQTEYLRAEPMHFPKVQGITCLTPRIEFNDGSDYYTNLYEFDGRVSVHSSDESTAVVSTSGELKDRKQFQGGVGYIWTHSVFDDAVEKSVQLRYHGRKPAVRIVEPIVQHPGMSFKLVDSRTVLIQGGRRDFRLELVEGGAQIELGKDKSRYWFPFPSMKCFPVVLKVPPPQKGFEQKIIYRISINK